MNNRENWIKHGVLKQAKYMIIACDGKSCDDYPVYCYSKDEVEKKLTTEFNFFNLDCKTHHGVINLDDYKKNHTAKNNDERKYGHMQLRTLSKKE